MLKILKSALIWLVLSFVLTIVFMLIIPQNDRLIGFIMTGPMFVSAIVVSHISPLYDLYGEKWNTFTTIFRYVFDCIFFAVTFIPLFPGANGLIILAIVFLCPYVINAKKINETLGYLKRISPERRRPSASSHTQSRSGTQGSPTPSLIRTFSRSTTMARIDAMDGHDFEKLTAALLRELGYDQVKVTPASGDQGVDVIAVKDGKKYAIQCKRYSQKLGNTPIQEVHAGKTIYGCNVAVVLTNNYFTDGGKAAARALGVELWDRDTLQRMLNTARSRSST